MNLTDNAGPNIGTVPVSTSPGSPSSAVLKFQLSNKEVRRNLVREALLSVGELITNEKLELAEQQGYRNFGQILFGKKPQQLSGDPTKALSGSTVDANAEKRIVEMDIRPLLMRAIRSTLDSGLATNTKVSSNLRQLLVESVELAECVRESVSFALFELSKRLPPDVLRVPSILDSGADVNQDIRQAPKEERSLLKMQLRREEKLTVTSNPFQASCDRHGMWYSLTQPEAPCPPLHMNVPPRFHTAVLASQREAILSPCVIGLNPAEDVTQSTYAQKSKMTPTLKRLSDAYLKFLLKIRAHDHSDYIISCAPQVIAKATRLLIETRRESQITQEIKEKHIARLRKAARSDLIDDSMLSQRLSETARSDAAPLFLTDEEWEEYRTELLSKQQNHFSKAMATLQRDLVWLIGGIDRKSNWTEAAGISDEVGYTSIDQLRGRDKPIAGSTLAHTVSANSAVRQPLNSFDQPKPPPVLSWQLCFDGSTSFAQFKHRADQKRRYAVEQGSALTARAEHRATLCENNPANLPDTAAIFEGLDAELRPPAVLSALHSVRSSRVSSGTARVRAGPEPSKKPTSVTAQIVGSGQSAVVERMKIASRSTLRRGSVPLTDIGLPHAQQLLAAHGDDDGRLWYEQGRRFGPLIRRSEVPYGYFDLNTCSPLVSLSLQRAPSDIAESRIPRPPSSEKVIGPATARCNGLETRRNKQYMRWLF